MADGEAREPEDGETAEAMKAEHTGRRSEAAEGQAGPSSPSKRAQPDPSSPRWAAQSSTSLDTQLSSRNVSDRWTMRLRLC